MDHSRIRYLEAKRTVDGRALNRRLRRALLEAVPDDPRVFEAGCGTGTAVPRLLDWGIAPASYAGVDRDEGVVAFAREVRPAELRRRGYDAVDAPAGFRLGDSSFEFRMGDALAAAGERDADGGGTRETDDPGGTVDLLVAGAFVDLVALDDALAAFERALAPGGVAYFPITFDGGTVLQPDHPADDAVVAAYHDHVDATPGRDSRAGRHLAARLQDSDGELLAMGASDWVVRPTTGPNRKRDGTYPADEAFFLATILEFVEGALESTTVDVEGSEDWLATRRRQLRAGELLYVAHQYDLLYRAPG